LGNNALQYVHWKYVYKVSNILVSWFLLDEVLRTSGYLPNDVFIKDGLGLAGDVPSVLCSRAPPAPERPHVLYSSDQIDYGAPPSAVAFLP
jgi:hypothetical protein